MSQCAYIFGQSNDFTPTPFDYYGQTGWFRVPAGWYSKVSPINASELIVSPNAAFTPPVYYASLHENQTDYVFQDLWLSMLYRTTGNNNGFPNRTLS